MGLMSDNGEYRMKRRMQEVGTAIVLCLITNGTTHAAPTAALPPSPAADAYIQVKYPPVPIEGTAWEKTVKAREARERKAAEKSPEQRVKASQRQRRTTTRPGG